MALSKIDHYSIRTANLEASRRFYTDVLQFRVGYRPPFPFAGAWMYLGDEPVVHLIEDREAPSRSTTGAFDHIAFLATDWPSTRARCEQYGIPYSEAVVPESGVRQVFMMDPSGVTIELDYMP